MLRGLLMRRVALMLRYAATQNAPVCLHAPRNTAFEELIPDRLVILLPYLPT